MARDLTIEEARRLARGPLGRELQRAALGYARPIYWAPDFRGDMADVAVRNGTTFFIDCGSGVFGVTAAHVFDAAADAAARGIRCQIGASISTFDLRERLIARGRGVDLATYQITPAEVEPTGATILTGWQPSWPPKPPELDRGVFYAGFPGIGRSIVRPGQIEFCAFSGSGVASSVSERDISTVIERNEVTATMGLEMPPTGFDLAGMSGAPMLSLVQNEVVGWRLAGVIYSCSRSLGEIVVAARADFIGRDGGIREG